jgi:hypothetical protein
MPYIGGFPIMRGAGIADGECFFERLTCVSRNRMFLKPLFYCGASDGVIYFGSRGGLCTDFIGS